LVAELKDCHREKSVSFGLAKSPETKEMKKHINSMISSQTTAMKHNATKDAMALLQYKLNTANEALEQVINVHEKLQHKMDMHLLEDSEEDANDEDAYFSSFEDRLNSATD
jgi:hypothetical protein